ncbi:hypothetical protein SEVIR_3G394133v4 [Setaria viridis]|uniref:BHLH domain-containing protein n=1 Tax=Setaria viridis TaxID=4556 RepID=A0A4U6VNY3_SETVI|nr:hypothetical protein SEVIR_3G394133v2 [Setaria viridis]
MLPDMEMTMNSQGSGLAHYYCPGSGGAGAEGFLGMFGDRHSSGDLFDLVRQGGAGGGSGMDDDVQPSHLPSSSAAPPPSEHEMAAWLYTIVRGDELVFTGNDGHPGDLAGHAAAVDDQQAAPVKEAAGDKREKVDDQQAADHKREHKLHKTEEKFCAEDSASFWLRKKITGGARKSHNAETHNLTEKRRRCKINEKFKTLQQLVPGCDKSNQVSTLDQTIQYIKSLQQQIQAMSSGCGVKPTAVYPVVAAPPAAAASGLMTPAAAAAAPGVLVRGHAQVLLAPPPAMVPFGALLPLVHHHQYPAAMASAPMLYPAAAAAAPNVSVGSARSSRLQDSHSA